MSKNSQETALTSSTLSELANQPIKTKSVNNIKTGDVSELTIERDFNARIIPEDDAELMKDPDFQILKADIYRTMGNETPIEVWKNGAGQLVVVEGHRRLRALTILKKEGHNFPCKYQISEYKRDSDRLVRMLAAGITGKSLEPHERANVIHRLLKLGLEVSYFEQWFGSSAGTIVSTAKTYEDQVSVRLRSLVNTGHLAFNKALDVIRLAAKAAAADPTMSSEVHQNEVAAMFTRMVDQGESLRNVDAEGAFRKAGYKVGSDGIPVFITAENAAALPTGETTGNDKSNSNSEGGDKTTTSEGSSSSPAAIFHHEEVRKVLEGYTKTNGDAGDFVYRVLATVHAVGTNRIAAKDFKKAIAELIKEVKVVYQPKAKGGDSNNDTEVQVVSGAKVAAKVAA